MASSKKKPNGPVSGVPLTESQIQKGYYISGGVDGVLTKLFNLMCLDLTAGNGIGPIQWNKLMIEYIRRISASKIAIDRTSIRGNMNKELRRPGMTWKVFCSKGLPFLKMDCFSISVNATMEDGQEVASTVSAAFSTDSKYRSRLPPDKYINPQGRMRKRPDGSPNVKGGTVYANDAGAILARLFNTLCLDMTDGKGISEVAWNQKLDTFIARHEETATLQEIHSARNNLKKEWRRGRMTWKVFCKGLQFLPVQSAIITVEAIREDGVHSIVDTTIVFSRKAQ